MSDPEGLCEVFSVLRNLVLHSQLVSLALIVGKAAEELAVNGDFGC